jgi:hypothetical protein
VSDVSLKTANRVEPKSRGGTRKVAGYVDPVAARETESNVLKGGWGGGPASCAQSDLILIYVFGRNTSAISGPSPPPPSPPHGISWSFGIIERRIDAARDHPTDKFTVSSGGIMRRRASPTMAETRWGP